MFGTQILIRIHTYLQCHPLILMGTIKLPLCTTTDNVDQTQYPKLTDLRYRDRGCNASTFLHVNFPHDPTSPQNHPFVHSRLSLSHTGRWQTKTTIDPHRVVGRCGSINTRSDPDGTTTNYCVHRTHTCRNTMIETDGDHTFEPHDGAFPGRYSLVTLCFSFRVFLFNPNTVFHTSACTLRNFQCLRVSRHLNHPLPQEGGKWYQISHTHHSLIWLTAILMYIGSQVIRQSIIHLFLFVCFIATQNQCGPI